MTITLPAFTKGIHYIELHGRSIESSGEYRFKTLLDISLRIDGFARPDMPRDHVSFRDVKRREWVVTNDGVMTIRAGYTWNGATPKKWIPLFGWVGTPDPEPTRLPTLFHDACFQFLRCADWPLLITEANSLFFAAMIQQGFRWHQVYAFAVRKLSDRFSGQYPRRGEHSVILNS